jgi:hypothetical protein
VLEVYKRPYHEAYPVVCMDEKPLQLLGDQRPSQPMTTTHKRREDSEYVRCGTCSIFMFNESLGGKRYVSAQEHRTKRDWAIEIKSLLTAHYPHEEKIVLVMDNLNAHTISSLTAPFIISGHLVKSAYELYGLVVNFWKPLCEAYPYSIVLFFTTLNNRIGS